MKTIIPRKASDVRDPNEQRLEVLSLFFIRELASLIMQYTGRSFHGNYRNSFGQDTLDGPIGLTANDKYIFVCDFGSHCVRVFDPTKSAFVAKFGSHDPGSGEGKLAYPRRIHYSPQKEEILVADSTSHLQVFSVTGAFRRKIPLGFALPRGLTTSNDGETIFVSSSRGINVFRNDEHKELWELEEEPGNLFCFENELYVADSLHNSRNTSTIRVLSLNGVLLKTLRFPSDVIIYSVKVVEDYIFVGCNSQVYVLRRVDGQLVNRIGEGKIPPRHSVYGLAVHDGELYLSDQCDLQVWE